MKITFNQRFLIEHSLKQIKPQVTINNSTIGFNFTATKKLGLEIGSRFNIEFEDGDLLFIKLSNDDNAFKVIRMLKGGAAVCSAKEFASVLSKYSATCKNGKNYFLIEDEKLGRYKLSIFTPKENQSSK